MTRAVADLDGMFAFAAVSTGGGAEEVVAYRHGPPLVLGVGDGESFLASDPAALLSYTQAT